MTKSRNIIPNNFPREGQHKPVTRDAVTQLERERPVPGAELHYTIDGIIETQVHSNLSAEREAAITNGSRRLHQASDDMRAGFGAAKPSLKAEYIRAQKTAARRPTPQHIRKYSPTR